MASTPNAFKQKHFQKNPLFQKNAICQKSSLSEEYFATAIWTKQYISPFFNKIAFTEKHFANSIFIEIDSNEMPFTESKSSQITFKKTHCSKIESYKKQK